MRKKETLREKRVKKIKKKAKEMNCFTDSALQFIIKKLFFLNMTDLQEVRGGLGQLHGQELEVVFVESAFKMCFHFLFVEGTEFAHRASEHHPDRPHGEKKKISNCHIHRRLHTSVKNG